MSVAFLSLILTACASRDAAPSPTPIPSATPTLTPTAAPTLLPVAAVTPLVTPGPEGGHTIGRSVEGRPIDLYRLGDGLLRLILVAGIHGGYERNTVDLAYALIDYYRRVEPVPQGVTLLIVPNANPDGLARSGEPLSRANARVVDLNRNWDCLWERSGEWSDGQISGGSEPFSEPETQTLRDLILAQRPEGVVFYHSAAGAVLSGGCGEYSAFGDSKRLAARYSEAAGYTDPGGGFEGYAITGDASNWVAGQGIPSITVELATHTAAELPDNLAGLDALIAYLSR